MNNAKRRATPYDEKGKMKIDFKSFRRVLKYLSAYKIRLFFVALCILVNAIAGVIGSMYLKTIIDGFITPVLKDNMPADIAGLTAAILFLAAVYLCGVIATFFQNRIMVTASQGVLKKIRTICSPTCRRCPSSFSTRTPTAT